MHDEKRNDQKKDLRVEVYFDFVAQLKRIPKIWFNTYQVVIIDTNF